MNFLAHCGLAMNAADAWECDAISRRGLLAGAVIGDFVKGTIPTDWPIELQAGVRLHRRVDALSNHHPGIRQHCDEYPQHLRRYAPIFVDMMADHCLAKTWSHYYSNTPRVFSAQCYSAIAGYEAFLSPAGQRFFTYMQQVDLLANYHEWPNIARGLSSVLRRLAREDWTEEVEETSLALVSSSQRHFEGYYPELQAAWHKWNAFVALKGG